jgi:hypothetical protein
MKPPWTASDGHTGLSFTAALRFTRETLEFIEVSNEVGLIVEFDDVRIVL